MLIRLLSVRGYLHWFIFAYQYLCIYFDAILFIFKLFWWMPGVWIFANPLNPSRGIHSYTVADKDMCLCSFYIKLQLLGFSFIKCLIRSKTISNKHDFINSTWLDSNFSLCSCINISKVSTCRSWLYLYKELT